MRSFRNLVLNLTVSVLFLGTTSVFAKDISSKDDDFLRKCQIQGAQQAWGADARFKKAPMLFKFVARSVLEKWFYDDQIPNDGIYIADDMDPADLLIYQNRASDGWVQADQWVAQGQEYPGYSYLVALFYYQCKDAGTP